MTHPQPPLDHDQFYRELTLRNAGFISSDDQCGLREAVILIAGCGSTGGSVIELLVRSGAEHLILADNGSYELNNANRQNMVASDVGRAKVEVFAERVRQINPYIKGGAELIASKSPMTESLIEIQSIPKLKRSISVF